MCDYKVWSWSCMIATVNMQERVDCLYRSCALRFESLVDKICQLQCIPLSSLTAAEDIMFDLSVYQQTICTQNELFWSMIKQYSNRTLRMLMPTPMFSEPSIWKLLRTGLPENWVATNATPHIVTALAMTSEQDWPRCKVCIHLETYETGGQLVTPHS
jgi:hypothetical protein